MTFETKGATHGSEFIAEVGFFMQRNISSDTYFNHKNAVEKCDKQMSKYGVTVESVPVDMNGALVPEKKPELMDVSDLPKFQHNIRERFSLESDDPKNDSNYY